MPEWILPKGKKPVEYRPIGVWVLCKSPVVELAIEFLPGYDDEWQKANDVLNRIHQNGIQSLPDDLFDYLYNTLSFYLGARGPIIETDKFDTPIECAHAVVAHLHQYWEEENWRLKKEITADIDKVISPVPGIQYTL